MQVGQCGGLQQGPLQHRDVDVPDTRTVLWPLNEELSFLFVAFLGDILGDHSLQV